MPTLKAVAAHLRASGGTLHLLGLVSDGGVHSHLRHLIALLHWANTSGLERVLVHAFTDGRDTSPASGIHSITELESACRAVGVGRIATVSGRYYAMDRDHRWERTQLAYDAIMAGSGPRSTSATDAINNAYAAGVTDEFIRPTVVGEASPPAAGDSLLFFNFRSDRMRQLVEACSTPEFEAFPRAVHARDFFVATMSRYEESLPVHVIFPSEDIASPVARLVSEAGLAQFHVAETEKYAHVTFFFNGGREAAFPDEERSLIPSPKIATYDLQPEMSASGVMDTVISALSSGRYAFIIVNFANCDMVGHTGSFDAAVRAVETVDSCLERVVEATLAAGGSAVVTADHGNAEEMIDRATGQPMTAHTTNPVPVLVVTSDDHPARHSSLRSDGRLSAVAPTLLQLLQIAVPEEMSEPSLLTVRLSPDAVHRG